ncbi:hypothetical protein [Cereibacter sphaeroides]|uniref:hypothetical protein n=1 Tax=Cereibacter sphaeroides TaxID=1063 RepID=UPI00313B4FE0
MPYHLVHVGKCAGESVIRSLRPQVPDLHVYHVRDANLRLADAVLRRDPSDIFIVLTRDPVARFVSAFEWDFHSKSIDGDGRRLRNEVWGRIFEAFRTANDLAEALTDPASDRRQLAFSAFTASKLHMQFDLGWYLPPHIAAELPAGRTHLIRTERLGADLARFLVSQDLREVEAPVTKNAYKQRLPEDRVTKTLSDLARRNIRLASPATYATLALIESRLADPEATVLG